MGLRGIIVAGLAGKERRDFVASEARQRAALHRLPTFAVLVLDGAYRRPIASPVAAVLHAIAGREGRWEGLAGLRRFAGGTFLEAGWVHVGGPGPVAIPLADLERFE